MSTVSAGALVSSGASPFPCRWITPLLEELPGVDVGREEVGCAWLGVTTAVLGKGSACVWVDCGPCACDRSVRTIGSCPFARLAAEERPFVVGLLGVGVAEGKEIGAFLAVERGLTTGRDGGILAVWGLC
jgi:hypothetical protein